MSFLGQGFGKKADPGVAGLMRWVLLRSWVVSLGCVVLLSCVMTVAGGCGSSVVLLQDFTLAAALLRALLRR